MTLNSKEGLTRVLSKQMQNAKVKTLRGVLLATYATYLYKF